jgi:transposase
MAFAKLHHPSEVNKGIRAYMELRSFRKAAEKTGFSKSSIHRWFKKWGEAGVPHRKLSAWRSRSIQKRTADKLKVVKETLNDNPDQTCGQIQAKFTTTASPSLQTISRIIKQLGMKRRRRNLKQICCTKEALEEKTRKFIEEIRTVDISKVISLDEVGFCSKGNAVYGYYKGKAPPLQSFQFKRKKVSAVVAVTANGIHSWHIQDKSINKIAFLEYFKKMLTDRPIGVDVVVMDNINFHHSKEIKDFAESLGVKIIYTPPYSPQFNPIELVFAQAKRIFRRKMYTGAIFEQAAPESLTETKTTYPNLTDFFRHSFVTQVADANALLTRTLC